MQKDAVRGKSSREPAHNQAEQTKTAPEAVPLTPDEEDFIRAFARASLTVPRALEADLVRDERMSLNEYFTLARLSEASGRRLRMSELAGTSQLSLSGMSRIVDHLERQNLVRRERSTDDGRGLHAVLTDAGFDRLRGAWPTHLFSVRRHMFDHVASADLPAFTAALQGFASACAGAKMAPPCPDDTLNPA